MEDIVCRTLVLLLFGLSSLHAAEWPEYDQMEQFYPDDGPVGAQQQNTPEGTPGSSHQGYNSGYIPSEPHRPEPPWNAWNPPWEQHVDQHAAASHTCCAIDRIIKQHLLQCPHCLGCVQCATGGSTQPTQAEVVNAHHPSLQSSQFVEPIQASHYDAHVDQPGMTTTQTTASLEFQAPTVPPSAPSTRHPHHTPIPQFPRASPNARMVGGQFQFHHNSRRGPGRGQPAPTYTEFTTTSLDRPRIRQIQKPPRRRGHYQIHNVTVGDLQRTHIAHNQQQ